MREIKNEEFRKNIYINKVIMRRMRQNYVFGLALLLWLTCSFSLVANPLEVVKKKTIERSFNVGSNDRLHVENRYGNITVTYWSKQEVALRVEIESKARNERRAEENLGRVRVECGKTGGVVSAITSIEPRKSGNGSHESFNIHYYIQMPGRLAAELSQKYGNIYLPDKNEGKMDIWLKYGNLKAGDFSRAVSIEAKYGNIEVGDLRDARLDLGYVGDARLGNVESLHVDSKYSDMKLKRARSLEMEMKYGNLSVESADELDLEIKYSKATIGELKRSLSVGSLSYSDLRIRHLSPSFKEIDVESHYGNMEVGVPATASFRIVANEMTYGRCDVKGFKKMNSKGNERERDFIYEINGGGSSTIHFDGGNYGNLKVYEL